MNILNKIGFFLLVVFAGALCVNPAYARAADEIVCTQTDAEEVAEIILSEEQNQTRAIYDHVSWNDYFAYKKYSRRQALALFACVRNTLVGLDTEIQTESDPERQRELTLERNMFSAVYVAMGRAIAPNVALPGAR